MQEISLFYGIRITMNFNQESLPNFQATFNNDTATYLILEELIDGGYLPNRQLKLVLAWAVIHKDELMQNWELMRTNKLPNQINPLI